MSYFLRSRAISICGLRLPLSIVEDLLDLEYGDDMSLYVEDSEETFVIV